MLVSSVQGVTCIMLQYALKPLVSKFLKNSCQERMSDERPLEVF